MDIKKKHSKNGHIKYEYGTEMILLHEYVKKARKNLFTNCWRFTAMFCWVFYCWMLGVRVISGSGLANDQKFLSLITSHLRGWGWVDRLLCVLLHDSGLVQGLRSGCRGEVLSSQPDEVVQKLHSLPVDFRNRGGHIGRWMLVQEVDNCSGKVEQGLRGAWVARVSHFRIS